MWRSIDCGIWQDPKVRKLDVDARLLFVYLIANQHAHVAGIYYLPVAYMAHELGMSESRASKALASLVGLVEHDAERDIVWVVNMAAKQCRSPKVWQAAARHVPSLHDSPLIRAWAERYADKSPLVAALLDTLPIGYRDTTERVSTPSCSYSGSSSPGSDSSSSSSSEGKSLPRWSDTLAAAYRDTFPHRPQPSHPLAKGVRRMIQGALTRKPIEEWLAYFAAIASEGRGGWLWTDGNLGMMLRPRTVEQWECGQYRPKAKDRGTGAAARMRDFALQRMREAENG